MRNAGLEEAQAGIKIAGRNINNLRYAETCIWHMHMHMSYAYAYHMHMSSDMQMTPPLWQKMKN